MWIMCGRTGDAFSSTDRAQGRHGYALDHACGYPDRKRLAGRAFSGFSTGFRLLYLCNNYL